MKFVYRYRAVGAALLSIGAFLLLWHLGTNGTALGKMMPGPGTVIASVFDTFAHPIGKYSILGHIGWSLTRVLVGYALAVVAGIAIGTLMGWSRTAAAIFNPIYQMIRPIPPIAWIPLAILWFGLAESSKYFLIFLASFNNITLNAYDGARSVDSTLTGASKMLGANNVQTLFTVVLPSSVPAIFAGLQVAIGVAWATVVAAEMVRSTEGAGWVIINGQEMNNTTQILVGIVAIGVVGFLLAILMRKLEERLCRWSKSGR
ncbi:MAG: ABC transporter permease [Oscillospiraceae bacterium]|nr:ABC transporter permease [Oscillospiraceae bacterium]